MREGLDLSEKLELCVSKFTHILESTVLTKIALIVIPKF